MAAIMVIIGYDKTIISMSDDFGTSESCIQQRKTTCLILICLLTVDKKQRKQLHNNTD